jgi:hypothetical protein
VACLYFNLHPIRTTAINTDSLSSLLSFVFLLIGSVLYFKGLENGLKTFGYIIMVAGVVLLHPTCPLIMAVSLSLVVCLFKSDTFKHSSVNVVSTKTSYLNTRFMGISGGVLIAVSIVGLADTFFALQLNSGSLLLDIPRLLTTSSGVFSVLSALTEIAASQLWMGRSKDR